MSKNYFRINNKIIYFSKYFKFKDSFNKIYYIRDKKHTK